MQVVVVPARERVVDGLAKLLERGGAGGNQDAARPGPQVPGVHAVHQLHRDRQMCPSHHFLHQKPTGRGPRVAQICGGLQLAHDTTGRQMRDAQKRSSVASRNPKCCAMYASAWWVRVRCSEGRGGAAQ